MQDFVSTNRMLAVAFIATAAAVPTFFMPHGVLWSAGLAGAGALLIAAFRLGTRSDRSIAQVLQDVEAERVAALAPSRS
jgi:hypothetical protein